jgi:hypothetical protein
MRDIDIRALCVCYGLDDPKTLGRLLALAKLDRERRKAQGVGGVHGVPGLKGGRKGQAATPRLLSRAVYAASAARPSRVPGGVWVRNVLVFP